MNTLNDCETGRGIESCLRSKKLRAFEFSSWTGVSIYNQLSVNGVSQYPEWDIAVLWYRRDGEGYVF
jgi:hypothetical protein